MNIFWRVILPVGILCVVMGLYPSGPSGRARETEPDSGAAGVAGSVQTLSGGATEGLPWNEHIVASYYGHSDASCWGGYGNRLRPLTDFFCALPASSDGLDCLGGRLACRIGDCGDADPVVDALLDCAGGGRPAAEFWPGSGPTRGLVYGWIIEGTEGDGLFRVLEIKPSGHDGPVYEAYVGDVGPWGHDDPYWVTGARPKSESGNTNGAGIDISYVLAMEMGSTGLIEVDWRWKTVDGMYVVCRRPTEWR